MRQAAACNARRPEVSATVAREMRRGGKMSAAGEVPAHGTGEVAAAARATAATAEVSATTAAEVPAPAATEVVGISQSRGTRHYHGEQQG
jgi:hypothetical protein